MLEIVRVLEQKHYTNTKGMTKVLARCLRCGATEEYIRQNVAKHNKMKRTHCANCIGNRYHRMTNTRIWRIWLGMRNRCEAEADPNYGGRGIEYCKRWERFENFYQDMRKGYSDILTLERIDVNGPYCKENCRWATPLEQQANKRNNRWITYQGEQIHLAEFCRRTGMSRGKLTGYLNRGMTGDQAAEAARASTYNQGMPRKPRSMILSTAARGTDS